MNQVRHAVLGLFFFFTIVALGVVTVYLGDFSFTQTKLEFVAWFDDVDGLGSGDPVAVHGFPCGRVEEITFNEDEKDPARRLRVKFNLKLKNPQPLAKDYVVAIGSTSLLGGKQIDVTLGTGAPLPRSDWEHLKGTSSLSLQKGLQALIGENRADVHRIVNGLANVVSDLDAGKRSLASVVLEKKASDDLNQAIASGRSILDKADHGEGSFAKALNSPQLHDSLVGFLDHGNALFTDAKEKPGVIHTLVYDEELGKKLKSGIEGLSATADRVGKGQGLLGKLTSPESDATWENFQSIVADARAGKGPLGLLLSDQETRERLRTGIDKFSRVADDFSAMSDGIRHGQGVLGYLVADDRARKTVERIVDQISRAVEDAREAAPVSSVASFLFGQL
jgi:ABC-type transporter Mla subunit MlaD